MLKHKSITNAINSIVYNSSLIQNIATYVKTNHVNKGMYDAKSVRLTLQGSITRMSNMKLFWYLKREHMDKELELTDGAACLYIVQICEITHTLAFIHLCILCTSCLYFHFQLVKVHSHPVYEFKIAHALQESQLQGRKFDGVLGSSNYKIL